MIRPATAADLPGILDLVHELAAYERQPEAVTGTVPDYERALFPQDDQPVAWAHVAEHDGELLGIAVWFRTFSTWTGRPGLWLEDLYVRPQHRSAGVGAALMATLAQVCRERGYPRMEWTVLDWNTAARDVYRHLGAEPMQEWTTQRLTGESLHSLADRG